MLGKTLLVVVLVVATTAIVAELVLLALAMLTVTIVAIVPLSIGPLTPVLVGKTLQFTFVMHALWRLMPMRQYLSSRDEYYCDAHNALTTPLLHSSMRLPLKKSKRDVTKYQLDYELNCLIYARVKRNR